MEFASNPVRALYFWQGGLMIWGGVIGGLIAVAILARQKGWRLFRLLDAAAPGIVLAQAIGRVACIITGDVMGKPTNGPFGFAYTNPNARVAELGVFYTPYPVYEIILNLAIFALVWRLRRRNLPEGSLFAVYMTLYSIGRFLLGFVSSYQIVAFGMTQSQIVALAALAAVVSLFAILRKRQVKAVHG
jgi:phosphatidylglycerol:prolipoprotein diacylglycerol transferase